MLAGACTFVIFHAASSCVLLCLAVATAEAGVTRLEVTRREVVLNGRAFGAAGPYEKLVGRVHFALDPREAAQPAASSISPSRRRNAAGLVEFAADFYLLKPVDPARGNGRLFYEAGNRGTKRILPVFQQAAGADDPTAAAEFGNGALMDAGLHAALDGLAVGRAAPGACGWRSRLPPSQRPADHRPRARQLHPRRQRHDGLDRRPRPRRLPRRRSRPAPTTCSTSARCPTDAPTVVPRARWRFATRHAPSRSTAASSPGASTTSSTGPAIRAWSAWAWPARATSSASSSTRRRPHGNPSPGLRHAIGWGVSQTGRFLRHFVYEGFNEDEQGRIVFDGVFDQVGGAGRGSFNHRFGQQSRDQLQHFNIQYPVDMFPFTDDDQTDPVTGTTDGLLARARRTNTVPRMVHLLTNSEYFNRAGSLVHTDVTGTRDVPPPATSRIYMVASAPHIVGPFPPAPFGDKDFVGQADMNPLVYTPVHPRRLPRARSLGGRGRGAAAEPLPDAGRRHARGARGGRLAGDSRGHDAAGADDDLPARLRARVGQGRVTIEPPRLGEAFVSLVPAVDDAGNDRGGHPAAADRGAAGDAHRLELPPAGHRRARSAGQRDRRLPPAAARPRAEREQQRRQPARRSPNAIRAATPTSVASRMAAVALVDERYLLAEDVAGLIRQAAAHYDWAVARGRTK